MKNFLIIDLEATCDQNGHISRSTMEVIEIGAVVIDTESFDILETFQGYIKPVINPRLTDFCIELTGITQNIVQEAPYFYETLSTFGEWLNSFKCLNFWGSWGAYDKNQIEQDCTRHNQDNPLSALKHYNLKTAYAAALNTRSKGMANAYKEIGQELIGRHHSGVDDAVNIARLLKLAPQFGLYLKKHIALSEDA